MLCEICGKKQATVHITEIINDKTIEMHLCENCAEEKGVMDAQPFGVSDLLAGFMGFDEEFLPKEKGRLENCPKCGMTFEDFRKTGRFGCAECYETFKKTIMPLLQKIHGSTHHFGKSPQEISGGEMGKEMFVKELQDKLRTAVEKEEFEEAARLRDKIKELQKE